MMIIVVVLFMVVDGSCVGCSGDVGAVGGGSSGCVPRGCGYVVMVVVAVVVIILVEVVVSVWLLVICGCGVVVKVLLKVGGVVVGLLVGGSAAQVVVMRLGVVAVWRRDISMHELASLGNRKRNSRH